MAYSETRIVIGG